MRSFDSVAAIIRNHPAKRAVTFIGRYLPENSEDIEAVIRDNPAEQAIQIISDKLRAEGYDVEIDMSPQAVANRNHLESLQPAL